MVINKNIGGCLWNIIKNDDVAFYEREEIGSNNILWGCNISEKALTIISIDVKTAEGEIVILNDHDDKDEERFRANCSYCCGIDIDNENDYQRNVNFLSQRKKFYVKLKDSTIWVCEFNNGLYAIFTVSKKGEVEPISKFLLSIGEALYQGEQYFIKQSKTNPVTYDIKELIKLQTIVMDYNRNPSSYDESELISHYSSIELGIGMYIVYSTQDGTVLIIGNNERPSLAPQGMYSRHKNIKYIPLHKNKVIFIFELYKNAYATILIELAEEVSPSGKHIILNMTTINPKNLACSYKEAIDICYQYIQENYLDTGKIICNDVNGNKVEWLKIK